MGLDPLEPGMTKIEFDEAGMPLIIEGAPDAAGWQDAAVKLRQRRNCAVVNVMDQPRRLVKGLVLFCVDLCEGALRQTEAVIHRAVQAEVAANGCRTISPRTSLKEAGQWQENQRISGCAKDPQRRRYGRSSFRRACNQCSIAP